MLGSGAYLAEIWGRLGAHSLVFAPFFPLYVSDV